MFTALIAAASTYFAAKEKTKQMGAASTMGGSVIPNMTSGDATAGLDYSGNFSVTGSGSSKTGSDQSQILLYVGLGIVGLAAVAFAFKK